MTSGLWTVASKGKKALLSVGDNITTPNIFLMSGGEDLKTIALTIRSLDPIRSVDQPNLDELEMKN
ncbi:MAG: hypothetical protein OXP71_09550 [Candidatus Poribacteria bacterium]|nr:hypothetical protein [Candidatus Poribacteria bacterium]